MTAQRTRAAASEGAARVTVVPTQQAPWDGVHGFRSERGTAVNFVTEIADSETMTRRVSELTTARLVAKGAGAREDGDQHEDRGVHSSGEIISIRPDMQLDTADALRESEARLRAILSSLDDLVFELDENGVYLAIWTTSEALLVAPPDELLGTTVRQALGDDLGRRVTKAIRRVLETGRPELLEFRLEVQAGARFFQARFAPIVGLASRTACLLVRDITAQKETEEARDDAERRLRYQALHDGLTDLPNRSSSSTASIMPLREHSVGARISPFSCSMSIASRR